MIYDSDSAAKNIRRSRAMNKAAEGKSQSSSSKNLLPYTRDFVVQKVVNKFRRTNFVVQIFVGQISSYTFCRINFVGEI
jgi:hypothetical protein